MLIYNCKETFANSISQLRANVKAMFNAKKELLDEVVKLDSFIQDNIIKKIPILMLGDFIKWVDRVIMKVITM